MEEKSIERRKAESKFKRKRKAAPEIPEEKKTRINLLKKSELIFPKGKIEFDQDKLINLSKDKEVSVIINKTKGAYQFLKNLFFFFY